MENIRCQSCFQEYTGSVCPHCGGAQNQGHQLPVGTLLQSRYRLGMVQEQSDMDITYLAWDTRTNTCITVKEFFLRGMTQRRDGSTFTEHISFTPVGLAARYKAALAQFLGDAPERFGENGTIYVPQRQICDMTLEEYLLSKGGTLSVEETLHLLEPVMHTLAQVHETGIIHGDIGMDSIVLDTGGNVSILGLRSTPESAGELASTAPKHGYAPIERYSPRGHCDPRSDEYSICAVIWHCLTGQAMDDAVLRVMAGPDPNWSTISGLFKKQQHILRKGVSVRPGDRYPGVKELAAELYRKIPIVLQDAVSAGHHHSVRLMPDGTAVAVGSNDFGQCNVRKWEGIVAVSAGEDYTVGLHEDGSVVAIGSINSGRCDVIRWSYIVQVSAKYAHTVGLRADGTVVAVGQNDYGQCKIEKWKDIASVSTGGSHTVGVKIDGSVTAVGSNYYGQCKVDKWTDIAAVSAGRSHTVGLKKDGSVVAVGLNYYGQCKTGGWKDVLAVSAGTSHTVGLRSDGTVVAVGSNANGQCDVESWTDIVAISAGNSHTLGLKKDGTVVAAGKNLFDMCDTEKLS